jgi:hypothetical protein
LNYAPWFGSVIVGPLGMDMESDLDFFTRRSKEERRAAKLALGPEAREMHERLASEYEQKVKDLRGSANDIR